VANLQEVVSRRNAVTAYSPTRVLDRPRANAGTAQRILQSRAAPAQYQPRQQQSFGGGGYQAPQVSAPQVGQARQPAMPNTAPPVRSLDEMLAHTMAPTPQQGGGGPGEQGLHGMLKETFGRALGTVVNNPVGRAIMAPLNLLDYGHSAIVSGVNEIADVFNGGDASWSDFVRQTNEHIGFGDIVPSTGNIWLDDAIGFVGDLALDPLTYVSGAGILHGAGREARLGLSARVLELTGDQALAERAARYGIHGLKDSERAAVRAASEAAGGMFAEGAEKIKPAGYYFRFPFTEHEFRLPASATVDRVLGGTASRGRATLAASPLGSWVRARRVEEGLVQAADRVLSGRGTMELSTALETINYAQAEKMGKRFAARTAEAQLHRTLQEVPKGMSMADYTELVERQGGQAGNTFYESMAKMLEDVRIKHGRVGPETAGGVHYFPRYMTKEGKGWYSGIDESAGGNIFGAGHSLDEYSPSVMTRHISGGDIEIGGVKLHLPEHATTRDINTEFRRVTGKSFNLFEEDFDKVSLRYIQNLAEDVGKKTGANRLLQSKGGLLRNKGDHEAMREIVDDVGTKLANEQEQLRLKDQLNDLGSQMDEARIEMAKGLHAVSSGFLKPRLQGSIDEMTALSAAQRAALHTALDQDERFSQLLGRVPYGAPAETVPSLGTLDAALENIWNDTAGELNRLGAERAEAARVLALSHDQLNDELSKIPVTARNLEQDARTAARTRKRDAELRMLRLQRDRSAIGSLHDMITEARIKAESADQLADDNGFLSLFLPGAAEARQGEVLAQRKAIAAEQGLRDRVYDRPEMSADAVTRFHNKERRTAFAANQQASAQVKRIEAASRNFVQSRRNLEDYVYTHAGALEGAKLKLEADTHTLATYRMREQDLIGVAAKRDELNAHRAMMSEFETGLYAQSRQAYEDLRGELNQLREAAEADARALAEQHTELVRIAREIDRSSTTAARNSVEPMVPVHPPLSMTPEQAAAMRADHARLRAEQGEFMQSTEGGKYLVLRTQRGQAEAEKARLEQFLADTTGPGKEYVFDANGNVRLREVNDLEGYGLAQELTDAEREWQLARRRVEAANAKLREAKLEGGAGPVKPNAEVRRLDATARAAAERLEKANEAMAAFEKRHFRPDVELTQRQYDAITKAGLRSKRLESVMSELDTKLTHYSQVVEREQQLDQMVSKLSTHSREIAERKGRDQAYADAVRAAEAAPRPRNPFTGEGVGPYERQARRINADESKALSDSARLLSYHTRWNDVPQITEAEALGLRGLSADERIAWNNATAIIRERHNFTGGVRNPIVAKARQTIKDLRGAMRNGLGAVDELGERRLERVYDQLDLLAEARGAFDPTAVQRKAIEGRVQLPEGVTQYEENLPLAELRRGRMQPREEAMRALDRGAGKGGKRNPSYEIADRARKSYRLARYLRDTAMPDLVERGALPVADRELRRVDVAGYINDSIAGLGQALERYGANPTSFAVNKLEQQAADVNRMAEFMVRYSRAMSQGIEPSDSVAAYILSVGLGQESEILAKQISRAEAALASTEPSAMYRRWQATFGTKLPPELAAARLTGEQMDELRHLSKVIPLEDSIANDQRLIAELDAKRLDGTFTSEDKGRMTTARKRIDRNRSTLTQLEQQRPTSNGTINQVIDRVVNEIEAQVHELDWSVTDFNDARHMVRDAQSIGEHRVRLEAGIGRADSEIRTFEQGARRLQDAIGEAESNGSGIVRYQPVVQDEFMMTTDQARAALDSGDIPAYLRPSLEAAIARVERGQENVITTNIQRVRAEAERLRAAGVTTPEARARLRGLEQRIASFEGRASELIEADNTVARLEDKARLTTSEQRDLAEARRLLAAEDQRTAGQAERAARAPKRRRKVTSPAIEAYAQLHGVEPTHVISSRVLREGKDVAEIPLEEARKLAQGNDNAINSLRAALSKRRTRLSALDGSINKDLRLQRQIIMDQMGPELPDVEKLQATIREVTNRAKRRRKPGDAVRLEELPQALAAAEHAADIQLSGKLLPHERELVELTQGRIDALNQFQRMTPEQLTDARNYLDELTKAVDDTRAMLGDHFDLAAATADGGAQFLTDLLSGQMELTARGAETLHLLYGPEQGEAVGQFVNMLHEMLGVQGVPTREDLRLLQNRFNMPPVTGQARSLLFGTVDPSLEDLRQLREAILMIPREQLDEVRMASREGWLAGLDDLLHPKLDTSRTFTADEVADVFRGLGTALGSDLPLLHNAERVVMDATAAGELVTDDTLRDAFREQLRSAAKAHHNDELRKSVDLVSMLGLGFSPGTPGFNGKLQSLGYAMSRQELDRTKLRRFVVDGFSKIGLVADETARERLLMRQMRKQRVDNMRIGLGAVMKDLKFTDPREPFEMLGHHTMDAVADIDRQMASFSGSVLPEGVVETINARAAELENQMQRAVEAGDYDRINEITQMQRELDGRVMTDPTAPVSTVQPTPEANPQVAYEAQVASAETSAANARDQLNRAQHALSQAKETQAGAQATGPVDLESIPELARHPDTPEDQLSQGEILRATTQFDAAMEAAAGNPQAEEQALNDFQDLMRRKWEGEPKQSQKAASDAYAAAMRGEGAPARTTNQLDAAQQAFDQAQAAADEAEAALNKLRQEGPAHTVPADTPADSLGEVDASLRAEDPDQALDWPTLNQEYDAAVRQLEGLDAQGPPDLPDLMNLPVSEREAAIAASTDSFEQARAQVAARVRKLATQRADMWPAEKARLATARRAATAEALTARVVEGATVPQRAVTWQWAQVLTKGTPSADVLRRGRGIPSPGMVERGASVGKIGNVVADVTGVRSALSGPFRQGALPQIESRLEAELEPVEAMRRALRGARDDANAQRARLQTLADTYQGRNIDAEIAAQEAERAEAEAFLSGEPGAATAATMTEDVNKRMAEADAAAATADQAAGEAMVAQRQKWEAAQRTYTDAVASADRGLAAVRSRILDTEAGLEITNKRLERAAALDFQGIRGPDFKAHIKDLREINAQRRLVPAEDQASIDMIESLLAGADDQLRQLEGLELSHADITKRLADFASGAASVADVMKWQINDGWVPMLPKLAQGSDGMLIRSELYRSINNMNTAMRKPQTWGVIGDYYTQFFKTYATATPGFHVRNLISGIFMNLVDNVRIGEMTRARRIWKDFVANPFEYTQNAPPDVQRALQAVFGSGAAGVFTDVANREKGRLLNNPLTRWNQRTGSSVEGALRLGMALDSMTKGQTLGAAMERIARYHFDYNSLSSLDHQARRLIPFWTYISRNIPLQIESMWLRPRTYLQYQHFVRNFSEAADPLTPDYWLSQGAFTMNQDAEGSDAPWYLAPALPHLRVAEPFVALSQGDLGRAIGGSVNINPMIAAPLEAFGFNQKLYTGAPVEENYEEPSAAMRALMPLFRLLGGTKPGGTTGHELLDDRYAHMARSTIPTLNLIERLTDNRGVREGRTDETWLRAAGAPVYQLTDPLRQSTRRRNYYARRDARRTQAELARK